MASAVDLVKRFYPDVEHVKDGKADLQVVVTKADSNNGDLKNHKECAMARACKRTIKCDGALISVSTAYIIKDDTAFRYRVPTNLQREIISFDRGAKFEPGEYELLKPGRKHRVGRKQGSNAPNKGLVSRITKPRHYTVGIRSSLLSASN